MFGRKGRRTPEITALLDEARAHPVGSAARLAALGSLLGHDAEAVAARALDLCRSEDHEDVQLGAEALLRLRMDTGLGPQVEEVTRERCAAHHDAGMLAALVPVHARALDQRAPGEAVAFLTGMLRHPDGRVRSAAASAVPLMDDPMPLVAWLVSLLEGDPLPLVATDAASGLARTICRDPEGWPPVAIAFTAYLDDPDRAVQAWWDTRTALLGASADVPALTDPMRDAMRPRLAGLSDVNWAEAAATAIGMFIDIVNGTLRSHAPAPEWDEPGHRAAVRDLLRRAATRPAGSEERDEFLVRLLPDPARPAWTDRRSVGVAVEEALAAGREGDAALGAGTLAVLAGPYPSRRIAAAMAELRDLRPDDPAVLAAMATVFLGLASAGLLDDDARRTLTGLLGHGDARVRASAALACDDQPERLARLLDADPDPDVRANAAASLAHLDSPAAEALARHLDDPDPHIRTQALTWALRTGQDGAAQRLVRELGSPDAPWQAVSLAEDLLDHIDTLPRRLHRDLTAALARLETSDWPNRAAPGDYPDPEARAAMLAEAKETARLFD